MNDLEQRIASLEKELYNLNYQVDQLSNELKKLKELRDSKIKYIKCPQCGSEELIVDDIFILASYPPQYVVNCKDCKYFYTIRKNEFNFIKYRRSDCAE